MSDLLLPLVKLARGRNIREDRPTLLKVQFGLRTTFLCP